MKHPASCLPLLLLLRGTIAATPRVISVAASVPKGASPPVDPSFPGLAFETSSFYNYAIDENGKPNVFSQNLIHAIFSRTGGPPILRVGGTSGDLGRYNASQKVPVSRPATEGGPAFYPPYLQLGPSYFEAYKTFPNAQILFQVPLAHYFAKGEEARLQNMLDWAEQGLAQVGNRLDALEIGNEPDYYQRNKFDIPRYINAFNTAQKALSKKFPKILGGKTIFQALDKAYQPPVYGPVSAIRDKLTPGAIKQFAYHYYQQWDAPWSDKKLEHRIMNHTQTVKMMRPFASKIKYWNDKGRPIRLLMDEVGGSELAGEGHNNMGTALWLADYLLHNMAIGMTRIHYQQIVAPGFNLWQPVKSKWTAPLVRANFYGMPFAADFIGGKNTRVNEIFVQDSDTLSAYTAWENGKVQRIALINMGFWVPSQGNRPKAQFTIKGLRNVKSAKIEYLAAPGGATAEGNLSWQGLEWTYRSMGKTNQLRKDTKTVNVVNGVLNIGVDASSALMITLNVSADPAATSAAAKVVDKADSGAAVKTKTVVVTRTKTVAG